MKPGGDWPCRLHPPRVFPAFPGGWPWGPIAGGEIRNTKFITRESDRREPEDSSLIYIVFEDFLEYFLTIRAQNGRCRRHVLPGYRAEAGLKQIASEKHTVRSHDFISVSVIFALTRHVLK